MEEKLHAFIVKLNAMRDEAKEEYLGNGSKDALGRYRAFAETAELARRMLTNEDK